MTSPLRRAASRVSETLRSAVDAVRRRLAVVDDLDVRLRRRELTRDLGISWASGRPGGPTERWLSPDESLPVDRSEERFGDRPARSPPGPTERWTTGGLVDRASEQLGDERPANDRDGGRGGR